METGKFMSELLLPAEKGELKDATIRGHKFQVLPK